jgi:hypothetical protein
MSDPARFVGTGGTPPAVRLVAAVDGQRDPGPAQRSRNAPLTDPMGGQAVGAPAFLAR